MCRSARTSARVTSDVGSGMSSGTVIVMTCAWAAREQADGENGYELRDLHGLTSESMVAYAPQARQGDVLPSVRNEDDVLAGVKTGITGLAHTPTGTAEPLPPPSTKTAGRTLQVQRQRDLCLPARRDGTVR